MPKENCLQQCLIGWLKYVKDQNIGSITHDAGMMIYNRLYV
jgi:hypothetical protein